MAQKIMVKRKKEKLLNQSVCSNLANKVIEIAEKKQRVYELSAFIYALEEIKKSETLTNAQEIQVWIRVLVIMKFKAIEVITKKNHQTNY